MEQGLVKESGKLGQVLGGLESGFVKAAPTNALEALKVVQQATGAAGLEPGIASMQGGRIVLQNVGGITTTLGSEGSILVQRGEDVLLHLVPQ